MIPPEPVAVWQYVDALVILFVSAVVVTLIASHKRSANRLLPSISQTIAANPRSSLVFSLTMTVAAPLYYGFIWLWVGPLVAAPWYFYALIAVSFLAEMVFVWVPATSGKSKRVHEITAGFVGLTMFVAPLILLFAANLSQSATVAVIVFIALSLIILALLAIPKTRKHTLAYEVIYCVLFWALMLFIAHM